MKALAAAIGCLAVAAVSGCSAAKQGELPANPCDLLSVKQVATAAGVEIGTARDVANKGEGSPSGAICRYETPSELKSISISFPERRGPVGTAAAPSTCKQLPRSRGAIAALGSRVGGSGGTAAVCVGPELVVWIAVEAAHERRANEAVAGVARAVLERLPN